MPVSPSTSSTLSAPSYFLTFFQRVFWSIGEGKPDIITVRIALGSFSDFNTVGRGLAGFLGFDTSFSCFSRDYGSVLFSLASHKEKGRNSLAFLSARCTLSFRPSNEIPSFSIVSIAEFASSLMAKDTYPTPFDTPSSRTTKADRTGPRSENNVCKSVEVAVYGRFETKSVDL